VRWLLAVLAATTVMAIWNRKALACRFVGCLPPQRDHKHQVTFCPRCGDPDGESINVSWGANRAGDGYPQTTRYNRRSGRATRTAL
jgi:hypothetical protein